MSTMAGGFDLSALQSVMDDPAIKEMAENIARDPAFAQMTAALQQSMPPGGAAGMPAAGAAAGPAAAAFDPSQYMEAMSGVLQNPAFMNMAEQLGSKIMQQNPEMMAMMSGMQDPTYREAIEGKLQNLKNDPELEKIMAEIETGGPAAMMKYWNDPDVLRKLGSAMGDMPVPGTGTATANGHAVLAEDRILPAEEEQTAEEEEEEATVHSAASTGDDAALLQLLKAGANKDEADEEGRTALHFAAGYGEIKCAEVLLEAGASVDAADNNQNTALHYAAGYGQDDGVALLLKHNANTAAKNLDGKTALEVAELNNQDGVVKLLKEAAGAAAAPAADSGVSSSPAAKAEVKTED